MKKIAILFMAFGFLVSCKSSAVVNEARKTMRGDWTLNSIEYPEGQENLEVTLFNDTSAECLENSVWNFVSNNNRGSYVPSNMGCSSEPRYFIWSVAEMDASGGNYDMMLKPTNEDYKSTTGNQGFRINLTTLTTDVMVWEQTINFEGRPFTIRMNFNKQ